MMSTKSSLWIACGISLAVLSLGTPLFGQFVYVANLYGNSVSAYAIDPTTGALAPVPGSPFATGVFPESVAVYPTGKFVYVSNDKAVSG
jgi:6-phosphogluconolactonase (cycloisomerase 2 family)